jgi:hypothetical protein
MEDQGIEDLNSHGSTRIEELSRVRVFTQWRTQLYSLSTTDCYLFGEKSFQIARRHRFFASEVECMAERKEQGKN